MGISSQNLLRYSRADTSEDEPKFVAEALHFSVTLLGFLVYSPSKAREALQTQGSQGTPKTSL